MSSIIHEPSTEHDKILGDFQMLFYKIETVSLAEG